MPFISIMANPDGPNGSSTPFPSVSDLNKVRLADSAGIGGNTLFRAMCVFKLYPNIAFLGARPLNELSPAGSHPFISVSTFNMACLAPASGIVGLPHADRVRSNS